MRLSVFALMLSFPLVSAQAATSTESTPPVAQSRTAAKETDKGEANESGSRALPANKTTKEERAKAREDRLKKTATLNKANQIGNGGDADESGSKAMAATKMTKEQRKKARDERLKQVSDMNKKGQIPKGESQ